jgi:hypothetical protein
MPIAAQVGRLLAVTVIVGCAVAPAASAQAPAGRWTFIQNDGIKHYACKKKGTTAGHWKVKTATFWNYKQHLIDEGTGVYAVIARGSDENLVDTRTSNAWRNGYIRTTLRGAVRSDRLWVQGAYYGPAEPWTNGFGVRRIVRCAAAD